MNRKILTAIIASLLFHFFLGAAVLLYRVNRYGEDSQNLPSAMEVSSVKGSERTQAGDSTKHSEENAMPITIPEEVGSKGVSEPSAGVQQQGTDSNLGGTNIGAELESPAQPPYPEIARRRGWQGEVALVLEISSTGEVRYVSVEHSSGHDVLDEAAVSHYRAVHYRPALENSSPVSTQKKIIVEFKLK